MPATFEQPSLFGHDDFASDPKDWVPAMMLASDLEREIAERRVHLLRRLAAWYSLIRVFRRIEDEQMVRKEADRRDLEYHRALISFIVGAGEMLVMELGNHTKIDPEHIGVGFKDVQAQLEELREDLRMWHGGMTAARRENILRDVFGVAQ